MWDLNDLAAFAAVARAGGFRDAARAAGGSASALSEAVRRLEARLQLRLLHRTTRSVAPTEAGARLLSRLSPALAELEAAMDEAAGSAGQEAGTLRLNVPVSAARLVLPSLVPGFLAAHPAVRLEITAEDGFVDVLAEGYDAGIRYEERLEQDMIAVPIGPREQRFAAAASAAYLDRNGRPEHPRDLLRHQCLRMRSSTGAVLPWEFARDGETVLVEPDGRMTTRLGRTTDLAVDVALADGGIVYLFEDWLRPFFARGALEPVLEPWWPAFSGPFLYYPGRRHVPPPLRAFIDFVRRQA